MTKQKAETTIQNPIMYKVRDDVWESDKSLKAALALLRLMNITLREDLLDKLEPNVRSLFIMVKND